MRNIIAQDLSLCQQKPNGTFIAKGKTQYKIINSFNYKTIKQ